MNRAFPVRLDPVLDPARTQCGPIVLRPSSGAGDGSTLSASIVLKPALAQQTL